MSETKISDTDAGETSREALTVYYDGECPLCRAEIGHYSRCRGAEAVAFVDVSRPDADPGPDLPRRTAMARFHVRGPDGRLASGAAGFATLWRTLPGWRLAGRIASLPLIGGVLEVAYRLFLPIRPSLARLVGWFGKSGERD